MRVLVTGTTGFIGGALARRLRHDGHAVTAFTRGRTPPDGCRPVFGQLEDLASLERAVVAAEPDAVFHLAAQAIVPYAKRDPWAAFEANVRGTYNLLEAVRRHAPDVACVVASSDKAYGVLDWGPDGWHRAYDERDPLQGRGPYDCSKSCADLIAQSYAAEYGLRVGIVRAGNVYGPGDTNPTRLIPSIVRDIIRGVEIRILSDGSPVRDYLHIDDAVGGYLAVERHVSACVETPEGRAFNLSGGLPVSVSEVVDMAMSAAEGMGLALNNGPIFLGSRTGEIPYQALHTNLARTVLGWAPRVGLRDGIEGMLRHEAIGCGRL